MNLELNCRCGKVAGMVSDISPSMGNRLVCYCKDCQAFARSVDPEGDTLNEYGGTDIFQTAPCLVRITRGNEFVCCLRLTEKGLYRWFASCCNTPIGNTGNSGMPFVGLIHTFVSPDQDIDSIIGPVQGSVFTKSSDGKIPDELKGPRSQFSMVFKMIVKLLSWKITSKGFPNPFFNAQGEPLAEPRVVGKGSTSTN